jgi:hypothetical protein
MKLKPALRQADDNRIGNSFCQIILNQLLPKAPGLDPDYGIVPWVVRRRFAEEIQRDRIFFDAVRLTGDGLLGEIGKQPLAGLGTASALFLDNRSICSRIALSSNSMGTDP